MKKIIILFIIVSFVISMQSCSFLCNTFCKKSKTQDIVIPSDKLENNTPIVKEDNLNNFVTNEIVPFYQKCFDTLVKRTSLDLLRRDKSLLLITAHTDSEITIKISELEEYHRAKSLLAKKCNSSDIKSSIVSLNNKKFAGKETDRMISLLENYGFIKQDLDTLIREINWKKKTPGGKDDILDAKINKMVFEFLYPDDKNNISMVNYPLVFDICNRILKSKREDFNKDILHLLGEN